MSRKHTTAKPIAKRTSRPAQPTTKAVESSSLVDRRPRQPRLRKTPPRGSSPKQPAGKVPRKKRGEDPGTIEGMNKEAAKLREARERISAEVVEEARATGMLPHEWLLAVMRGEQINHFAYDSESQEIIEVIVLPTFTDRMEAAKAAAPYYANKLQPEKRGAGAGGGFADPAKQRGVLEVPLVDSMEKWTEIAQKSQSLLKREVTK